MYIVSFDRPGYGESDPNPKRTVKSMALDIEELADQLGLGSKFYVVGMSMGGQLVWSCLKYIPNRYFYPIHVIKCINSVVFIVYDQVFPFSFFLMSICSEEYMYF